MAYEALDNLQRSLDQILKRYDNLIIIPVKQELIPIRDQAIVLQLNLKYFPYKERIREVANTTNEFIEYLFSEENLSDGESMEVTVKLTNKLRELARTLESTTRNVVDYIKTKGSISGLQTPAASQPVSSSSRAAAPKSKDVVVGFDEDLKVIKDRLLERSSRLQVLPIVGIGGIGKTKLAKIAYNNALVMDHFDICGWVTVSQDYSVASIALNLLASIKGISVERDVDSKMPMESLIRKHLKYQRYLIVMDDVCSMKAWDYVKMLLPDDYNGSRIIVTTRLQDVAAYVASSSCIHTMRLLDVHHSWNLLKQKVFADEYCPLEREGIGKEIAKSCGGLPLSIVLAAGLLSKIHARESWKQIAANGAQLETIISLSYAHLPDDSKKCFLYMAGFPEDYEIHVSELIYLWITEGFLKRSNESERLEEKAENCLDDLVERSLVLVTTKKLDGKIKSCSLHDIVRDFCVRQARKEKVILPVTDYLPTPILRRHFLPRIIKDHPRISATSYDLHLKDYMHSSRTRTIICIPKKGYRPMGSVEKFDSLRVLHVLCRNNNWDWDPGRVFDLIHSTYLALNIPNSIVPSAISKLQNLQTLIIHRFEVCLPVEIWRLQQLRHLIAFSFRPLPHPKGDTIPLENFETLSLANDFTCSGSMVEMIPNIKKLGICYTREKFDWSYQLNNLKHLRRLEKLKLEKHHQDFSSKKLEEMEMEMKMGMRGGCSYGELDELERRLNELEVEVHGGFPSRPLDEFLEMHGRFLSRLDEFEPDMPAHFLCRLPDEFKQEIGGGFSIRKHDEYETEMRGGFSFRRFVNILVRGPNHAFPLALRRLTLSGCWLSWSDMPVIGSLPKLQVIILRNYACRGLRWKTIEGEFVELRLLLIEKSTLRYWRAHGNHVFPRLECIMLHCCPLLSEIPSNIGGIPTLKLIEVDEREGDLLRSATTILDQQQNSGNYSFEVRVKHS